MIASTCRLRGAATSGLCTDRAMRCQRSAWVSPAPALPSSHTSPVQLHCETLHRPLRLTCSRSSTPTLRERLPAAGMQVVGLQQRPAGRLLAAGAPARSLPRRHRAAPSATRCAADSDEKEPAEAADSLPGASLVRNTLGFLAAATLVTGTATVPQPVSALLPPSAWRARLRPACAPSAGACCWCPDLPWWRVAGRHLLQLQMVSWRAPPDGCLFFKHSMGVSASPHSWALPATWWGFPHMHCHLLLLHRRPLPLPWPPPSRRWVLQLQRAAW